MPGLIDDSFGHGEHKGRKNVWNNAFGTQEHNFVRLLKVVGWGKVTNAFLGDVKDFQDLGVSQRILQKLEVPIMSHARCKAIFSRATTRHFCAGGVQGTEYISKELSFCCLSKIRRANTGCVR